MSTLRTRPGGLAGLIVGGLAVGLMLLATASPASALTIRSTQSHVTRLGHFRTSSDLGHAIHTFGRPSSRHHVTSYKTQCHVAWRKLKLRIEFVNYGGRDACSKHGGQAQSFSIGFEKRWRTSRHLRVGQPVKRLKD